MLSHTNCNLKRRVHKNKSLIMFSLTQSAMDTFPATLLNRKIYKHTHTYQNGDDYSSSGLWFQCNGLKCLLLPKCLLVREAAVNELSPECAHLIPGWSLPILGGEGGRGEGEEGGKREGCRREGRGRDIGGREGRRED